MGAATKSKLFRCFGKDKRCPSKSHYNFVFLELEQRESPTVQQIQISLDLIRFNCLMLLKLESSSKGATNS